MQQNRTQLTLGSLFSGSGGFELGGQLAEIKPIWNSEVDPFCVAVTRKNFPCVKHYGDINELNGAELEPVDVITFGSPCFPAGTLVLTDDGYIEIENIKVGMRVLTHKGRWKRVTAVGCKKSNTVILRGNHYGLECTPNHPIYTTEECKVGNRISLSNEKLWLSAEKMKGRLWAVPRSVEKLEVDCAQTPKSPHYKPMPTMDEDFFYFVGRWLGDGWVRDAQRPDRPKGQRFSTIFLCDSCDKEHELCNIVGKLSEHYSVERGDTCVKVKFNGRLLCDWLTDNFGRYAYGKKIPSWVYGLPKSYRGALLRGIFESDGYHVKGKREMWKVLTVSKKLAEGLRILGELEGYSTTVHYVDVPPTCEIEGRTVTQRPNYTVVFCDISGSKRNHLQDDLHSWYRVKSVKETGEEKTVYNITVEEDNSYVADGIVVHNCQDMSIAGKRSGLGGERSSLFYEAVRIVKEMREKTNGQYPRYIVWENVPGAFSSNGGEDFRCVLEEICKVKDERISISKPDRWTNAGEIVGDKFSLAWRVLDAQYWGVPQRRKRIFLVADFADTGAGKILFESEGLSRYTPQGFRSWQRTAGSSPACSGTPSLCLNDQGGQRMDVTDDVTSTLRAEAHHPPCVMSAGFCTEHSANARGIGYEEERSPTLRAGVVPAVVPLENHPTDGRVKIEESGMVQTLSNRMGTGGNNVPLLMEEQVPITLKIRSGCPGGGKGQLCQVDKSATLGCNNDQTLFVPEQESCYWDGGQTAGTLTEKNARGTQRMPDKDNFNCVLESNIPKAYGISSFQSNAMLSDNPHSGIYEAETSRTLDTGGGNPDCNQGGVAIVEKAYSIQGNLIGREDKNGPQGNGINEDISFTLNATDHHAVCTNGKEEPKYTVRRLTPTECARLQGFPDCWCKDLGKPNPTDEEVAFWTEVWETYRKSVLHSSKPKAEKQVRKWLANPYSDSAEYRLWGNGVALPCVYFIMCGIVWAAEKEEK